jgi:uncharacterized membrane protein
LRRYPPLIGAFGLFAGMALSFGLAAGFVGLHVPASSTGWILLVFIALGPGALTMTLFSFSVPRLGASGFAILANVELVTVVLFGVLVLGEAFTTARAIGGALIVAGILIHALARERAPHPNPLPPGGALHKNSLILQRHRAFLSGAKGLKNEQARLSAGPVSLDREDVVLAGFQLGDTIGMWVSENAAR